MIIAVAHPVVRTSTTTGKMRVISVRFIFAALSLHFEPPYQGMIDLATPMVRPDFSHEPKIIQYPNPITGITGIWKKTRR
jgi:hypothetical protein